MKTRKILPIRNFNHKFFAVVAVFTLIAFLLTLKPVAEFVQTVAEKLKIDFPPLEVFRNTAANFGLVGAGIMLALFAFVVAVPIVKIAVTVVAVSLVAVGLYNVYKTFFMKDTQKILPTGTIKKG